MRRVSLLFKTHILIFISYTVVGYLSLVMYANLLIATLGSVVKFCGILENQASKSTVLALAHSHTHTHILRLILVCEHTQLSTHKYILTHTHAGSNASVGEFEIRG